MAKSQAVLSDSLRAVVKRREKDLQKLTEESSALRKSLTTQIDEARSVIADLSAQPQEPVVMRAIAACSLVFNTCEQTVSKQKEEKTQLQAQIQTLTQKLSSDSARYEADRRAWLRRESSLTAAKPYKAVGATAVLMGAACYVSHMSRR